MRIAFLCGNLEPGRDGVGDYTRLLAAECIRQGHECQLVALNDCGAGGHETQECNGVQVECLRCPASLPWKDRFARAREALQAFNPDWVSLQFVPYGFHPKGIAWRLAGDLKALIGARPLQIMFHELWIGFGAAAPLKQRLVGLLQRYCIFRMIRMLTPRVVHTSNATYARLLKGGGVAARELPLFGNIPVRQMDSAPELPAQLLAAGIPADPVGRNGWWLALFFGTLHPEWHPQPLTSLLLRAAKRTGRRLCLVSAGRLGAFGEELWEKMQRESGQEIVFVKCGEQTCEEISTLLQIADFGVAVTPWELMGKSGSAAAMLDHGLPILFTREDASAGVLPAGGPLPDPLFYRCDATLEEKLIAGLQRREPTPRVREICAGFIAALPVGSRPVPNVL
ncbi:MAG: glycosyltransferase [Verrucomicrobiota bacterium]